MSDKVICMSCHTEVELTELPAHNCPGVMVRADKVVAGADAYTDIGLQIAMSMVEDDPERVLSMIDRLHQRLREAGVKVDELTPDELDAAVGGVWYFVGVNLSEGLEDIRAAIDAHLRTCKDHKGHILKGRLLRDGVGAIVQPLKDIEQ